ncbi:Hypothetical protein of unknown function [Listeria monocytogenes serotype 4b str. CLIP 80459]|nr:Hypothetical protein of unknown function [Listeria monocytogenes serotype 4b str. CLIP 80459]
MYDLYYITTCRYLSMVNSPSGCSPKHPYLCSLRISPVAFINIGKCRTPRTFPCSRSFHLFSVFYKKILLVAANNR